MVGSSQHPVKRPQEPCWCVTLRSARLRPANLRRCPLRLIGLAVVLILSTLAPLIAGAQQAGKLYRIGFLGSGPPLDAHLQKSMEDSLRDLGYVLGQRVTIEYKASAGDAERLRQFAAEFVRLPVDLIITDTNPAIAAAKQATATIPIVMVTAANPIGAGFVQSLSRPGGNVTGLSADAAPETILGKQVALLLEFVPKLSRLAVLWNPAAPAYRVYFEILKSNVRQRGINLQSLEVESPAALEKAFDMAHDQRAEGLLVFVDIMTFVHRKQIADLAKKHRLPSVAYVREFADAGGLLTYGADLAAMYRRAAYYVDRIVKGTKPADLPVEQPTKFLLVINHRTAKMLGLTVPPSLLLQADQVIE